MIANLLKNVVTAKEVLRRLIPAVGPPRTCGCPELLRNAIITNPTAFAPKTRKRLDLLIGKYFGPAAGPGPISTGAVVAAPAAEADDRRLNLDVHLRLLREAVRFSTFLSETDFQVTSKFVTVLKRVRNCEV